MSPVSSLPITSSSSLTTCPPKSSSGKCHFHSPRCGSSHSWNHSRTSKSSACLMHTKFTSLSHLIRLCSIFLLFQMLMTQSFEPLARAAHDSAYNNNMIPHRCAFMTEALFCSFLKYKLCFFWQSRRSCNSPCRCYRWRGLISYPKVSFIVRVLIVTIAGLRTQAL
jgi:hypothetical protein